MESTDVIIARLVLGYLKKEMCRSYKEFLRTSRHLQNDLSLAKSKYLPTRFGGLTLDDILSEYFEISRVVQGRLELTNYYNECHSKTSLLEQLLYLLNKVHSSRNSTPCPRSPDEYSNLDRTSPSNAEHVSDIETTPVHTLPGNIQCTCGASYSPKTSRRKQSKHNKSATLGNLNTTEKEDMSEVLAQTLLENKEFHEKIAQTINKVAEKQYKVSAELDKTIKTVVKETEEDPIFDKILEEIIGSTNMIDNKGIETSSTTSSIQNNSQSCDNRAKKSQKKNDSVEHNRITTLPDSQRVAEQNEEAVRSIIANSKVASKSQTQNSEEQGNGEVIVFDGSLDKYLTTNTYNMSLQTQPVQNPIYVNTSGLLMFPSNITTNTTGNLYFDSTKQYYLVNKQTSITEQDIIKMPTVIVSDGGQNTTITKPVLQATVHKQNVQPIVPKPIIEIGNVGEYRSICNTSEPSQIGLKKVVYPKTAKKCSEAIKKSSKSITGNDSELLLEGFTRNSTEEDQPRCSREEINQTEKANKSVVKNDSLNHTPSVLEPIQKVTPKSGSHVRNLDFSTPPRITSTHKKISKSKQSDKTSSLSNKKQATKTLFRGPNENARQEHEKKLTEERSNINTWDADLRAVISAEETKSYTPKRRRKAPIKQSKRKIKKGQKMRDKLNTTVQDADILETPLISKNEAILKDMEANDKIEKTETKNTATQQFNIGSGNDTDLNSKKNDVSMKLVIENAEDASQKMILSPSKLNANKRNLVNIENPTYPSNILNNSTEVVTEEEKDKFVTPELKKENFNYPIKSSRNLTPILEDNSIKNQHFPKTPNLETSMADLNASRTSSIFTPFSKMLEANLKCIDINSIPTPSMPITPSFPPFTPTVDLMSPYSNRPTDYSTSSSYYQPSDNEQNKSLEAQVLEVEKKPVKVLGNVVVNKESLEQNQVDADIKNKSPVNEHLSIFNKNVIGKKNLNLMKKPISSSSSSSESVSDTTSADEDNSSCDWAQKESNDTVIFKKQTEEAPQRTYSLRNRNIIGKEPLNYKSEKTESKEMKSVTKTKQISKESKIIPKVEKFAIEKSNDKSLKSMEEKNITVDESSKADTLQIIPSRQTVLKELEEKRLRTISKFKNNESTDKKVASKQMRQSNGKFMKIKPIPNINNSRKRPRKSDSPKKTVQTKRKYVDKTSSILKCVAGNYNNITNNIDLKQTLAEDRKKFKNIEKTEKSASDVEVQNMIEGLKERGIHLMHNKSPIKKDELCRESDLTNINLLKIDETINLDESKDKRCSNILETSSVELTEKNEKLEKSELSSSHIESELRDMYDTKLFEGEYEHVVFDESKQVLKPLDSYSIQNLDKKTFLGKVFVEEINKEIDVPLIFSPFYTLLDIAPISSGSKKKKDVKNKPSGGAVQPEKLPDVKTDVENNYVIKDVVSSITLSEDKSVKLDDDLMNYALVGSEKEETPDRSESPQSSRKRKNKSDGNSHTEKKCKTLLKKINVDSFLNNIHGGK